MVRNMLLNKIHEIQNIVHIKIEVAGRVTQSDIIGAVFGQTEEVLGDSLDLRQLQRDSRIGRIEVEVQYNDKGTYGMITVPSYMDSSNTVLIAAALETIQKIGPCTAVTKVQSIENIRDIKRKKIVDHAKKVLEKFMSVSIESQEVVDDVTYGVRMEQVESYGEEGVPAGPSIDNYDEIIFVETVDELKNLLKYGIKNVVAFEDCSKKKTLADIASRREVIVFVNRGKEFFVKKLLEFCDIDNYTKPDVPNKRITELISKELFKSIRSAVSTEQIVQRSQFQDNSRSDGHNERNERGRRDERPESARGGSMNIPRMTTTAPAATTNTPEGEGGIVAVTTISATTTQPGNRFSERQNNRPEDRHGQRRDRNDRDQRGGGFRQRDDNRDHRPGRGERTERSDRAPRRDGSSGENQQSYGESTESAAALSAQEQDIYRKTKATLKEGDVAILDTKNNLLGQIPLDIASEAIASLPNVGAIIVNGSASQSLISAAEQARARCVVANKHERSSRFVKTLSL